MGTAQYIANDDTRKWVETYRYDNKIKPALVFRAATDANYINDQLVQLPAYGGKWVNAGSICNIISPGQRIPGLLNWQVTESLDNVTQTANLSVLDALPQSKITGTATGFGRGTKGEVSGDISLSSNPAHGSQMFQQWHSTVIRYQWVKNGLGVAVKLPKANKRVDEFLDPTLAQNVGFDQHYREANLLYRIFEPEIIQMSVSDLANFPDPAVPVAENEGDNEWWDVDYTGSLKGMGAYFILVDNEVMRVTRIDRANGYIFIVPGGRGISGNIDSHSVGATNNVTLLGYPPYNGMWSGLGYLMPHAYKVIQSTFRPGNCFVSYEGYGNPGNYTNPYGLGPFSSASKDSSPNGRNRANFYSKTFDRHNNMVFTGYWFSTQAQVTLDSSGVPQLSVTFQSPGYLLSEQKIDPQNVYRSKNVFGSWATTTFDEIGYTRKIPGDWYDYTQWDPNLPGSYPFTISTEYAQHKAFMEHMNNTDSGRTCEFCQAEWIEFVKQHEKGKPTGSIAEARAVGKHIYKESIRVFNKGGQFNAGPVKTFGRLMHALACACWEHPLEGNELGTRWSKIPHRLFTNLNTFTNGRVWNGKYAYQLDAGSNTKYDWSNSTNEDLYVHGKRVPLKCAFTTQYDRQPWSQPMQDLADLNRMTYTLSRAGYPIFVPIGRKLRGMSHSGLKGQPGFHGVAAEAGKFADGFGNETADTDIGTGEWHLKYGASIDNYSETLDVSSILTLVYVSAQTAFGDEISFTIPAAGTGYILNRGPNNSGFSNIKNDKSPVKLVQYSSNIGNKEGLQFTCGAQQSDAVTLDNVLLGLDWNTDAAGWGLTLKRGPDGTTQVDSQPPVPIPQAGWNISLKGLESKHKNSNRDNWVAQHTVKLKKLMNFFLERRYIGQPVYTDNSGAVQFPIQLHENDKFSGNDGKALDACIRNLQNFLTQQATYVDTTFGFGGIWKYENIGNNKYKLSVSINTASFRTVAIDAAGQWGPATATGVKVWLQSDQEYIKTDIWWYVQNGLPWDQYVAAVTNFPIPQDQLQTSNSGGWQIDQNALKTEAQEWMRQFFTDAITYGNSLVDESINKAFQKTISTNLVDPRIQLGDVIWATVPGYVSDTNSFGDRVAPFLHGIYVTGITRTMDLQQGTYQGSYQGYRYRGTLDPHGPVTTAHNYVSTDNEV